MTYSRNLAARNAGSGFQVTGSVVDGGGNVARANGS